MTDPVQIPPLPPGQARPSAPPAPETNAQIVSLPPGLDVRDIVRLRGEVLEARADGVVRILTAKGEVEVRLNPGEPLPARGDTVEIEIQPGRPPTARVTIEEAAAPPPRTAETPVDVRVREREPVPEAPAPQRPAAETPVRLEPITYEQALAFVREPLETILSSVEQRIESKVQIVVTEMGREISAAVNTVIQTTENPVQSVPLPENIISSNTEAEFLPSNPPTLPSPQWGEGYEGLARATLELTRSWVGGEAASHLSPIQISKTDILKLEASPAIPQMLHARIAAVQIPPSPLFEPAAGNQNIPKLQSPAPATESLILKNQQAGTIIATVIGHTPQNLPVIGFFTNPALPEDGSFFILHTPAPALVPGTEIALIPRQDGMVILAAAVQSMIPLRF